MLSCPFLHAHLSFLLVWFPSVLFFEAFSPSCFGFPLCRNVFIDLPLAAWIPFRWIPSENLIITDPQLVPSPPKAHQMSVCVMFRSQYVSCGGKILWWCFGFWVFFGLNRFGEAALASAPCMDEFCKWAVFWGGSDQLGDDGSSLSWLCCCWKSILQLPSQKTLHRIKCCYGQLSCRKLFFFSCVF